MTTYTKRELYFILRSLPGSCSENNNTVENKNIEK